MRSSGYGDSLWAPSPIESLHARVGAEEPNQEMYKTFMFKKTMVIVACLLAAVVVVAHWSSAVRFIMFLLHRSRGRRSSGSGVASSDSVSAAATRSVELFKAEQRDSDSKPLRPIQMVRYSAKGGGGVCRRMGSECMICLVEFKSSEKVGLLPECGHGFHRPCIEMWLFSHSNCPICRHSLMQHQDLDPAPSPP